VSVEDAHRDGRPRRRGASLGEVVNEVVENPLRQFIGDVDRGCAFVRLAA